MIYQEHGKSSVELNKKEHAKKFLRHLKKKKDEGTDSNLSGFTFKEDEGGKSIGLETKVSLTFAENPLQDVDLMCLLSKLGRGRSWLPQHQGLADADRDVRVVRRSKDAQAGQSSSYL